MTLAIERELGTNGTAGARRIHQAFARARAEGRPALIPYVVAGYPDHDTSFEIALAVADAGAPTCSRSVFRTRIPWPTVRRSSARPAPRCAPARRSNGP